MALYRLLLRTISRGRGEVAVAAAAYIGGIRMYLEPEDRTFDFSWRTDVVHRELEGAYGWTAPELWNESEWAEWERRWDGVTAREILVALPHELPLREQIHLARELACFLSGRYGVAVDWAVHEPTQHANGHQRRTHAHLLFTTRVMTPEGLREKTRILDVAKTGGPEVRIIREEWARLQNVALERAGLEVRVDHRSYRDQGILRVPGVHLGRILHSLEKQGTHTRAGDYNQSVDFVNRVIRAVGHEQPVRGLDWEAVAREFTDEHAHQIYNALHHRLIAIGPSEKALERDPLALAPGKVREIQREGAELRALQVLLKPGYDTVRRINVEELTPVDLGRSIDRDHER